MKASQQVHGNETKIEEMKEDIKAGMKTLSPREKRIILLKSGIVRPTDAEWTSLKDCNLEKNRYAGLPNGKSGLTSKQIGHIYGISHQRVSQIAAGALIKIREQMTSSMSGTAGRKKNDGNFVSLNADDERDIKKQVERVIVDIYRLVDRSKNSDKNNENEKVVIALDVGWMHRHERGMVQKVINELKRVAGSEGLREHLEIIVGSGNKFAKEIWGLHSSDPVRVPLSNILVVTDMGKAYASKKNSKPEEDYYGKLGINRSDGAYFAIVKRPKVVSAGYCLDIDIVDIFARVLSLREEGKNSTVVIDIPAVKIEEINKLYYRNQLQKNHIKTCA